MDVMDYYAAGFMHASDLACTIMEKKVTDMSLPLWEQLNVKDCAGRERALRYLRLPAEDKLSRVTIACKADPKKDLSKAVASTIVDLK